MELSVLWRTLEEVALVVVIAMCIMELILRRFKGPPRVFTAVQIIVMAFLVMVTLAQGNFLVAVIWVFITYLYLGKFNNPTVKKPARRKDD